VAHQASVSVLAFGYLNRFRWVQTSLVVICGMIGFPPRLTKCIVRAKAGRQLTGETRALRNLFLPLRFRRLGGEFLKRDRRRRVPANWERPNIFASL
jgi:hypothetical protein